MLKVKLNYRNMTDLFNAIKFSRMGGHGSVSMDLSGEKSDRIGEVIDKLRISRGLSPRQSGGISMPVN